MLLIEKLHLGKDRLKSIDLKIQRGKITLLLGKSGSGKTTLLRCIAQLETGYEGNITFQDTDVKALPRKVRAQTLGFISQFYPLLPNMPIINQCIQPLKLIQNFDKNTAYSKSLDALSALGIVEVASSLPHQISGGQKQRVAIAKALLLDPKFLLFDEPTSALDPKSTQTFAKIATKLAKEGKGVVIATHDVNLIKQVLDQAYLIEKGEVIENYDASKADSVGPKLKEFLTDC